MLLKPEYGPTLAEIVEALESFAAYWGEDFRPEAVLAEWDADLPLAA